MNEDHHNAKGSAKDEPGITIDSATRLGTQLELADREADPHAATVTGTRGARAHISS